MHLEDSAPTILRPNPKWINGLAVPKSVPYENALCYNLYSGYFQPEHILRQLNSSFTYKQKNRYSIIQYNK